MAADVLNTDDTIDSRDVIARVEELESDIESWNEDIDEHETNMSDLEEEISEAEAEAQELDDDKDADEIEQIENNIDGLRTDISDIEDNIKTIRDDISEAEEELNPLKAFADEAEGYAPDWNYGATLVRDSYFEDYARELVNDIGDLPSELPAYIENNIDWEGVADDIQADYSSVDFDGEEYWVR